MWPKSHCKNTKVGRLSQIFRTFVLKFGGGEVEGGQANFGNVKIYESPIPEIGPILSLSDILLNFITGDIFLSKTVIFIFQIWYFIISDF